MGGKIRQLRMKVKVLDFEQMLYDIALLKQLKGLKIPKGRRGQDVAAGFTVRPKKTDDSVAGFKVEPGAPEEKK